MMDITGIGSIADFAGKVLDRVIPDPVAAAQAKVELAKAQMAGEFAEAAAVWDNAKAQAGTNTAEASNASVWVSGWRPFIGWICGAALAYASIISPLMVFIHDPSHPPAIDTTVTMQILFGLLGLGAMRSYDKKQGTAR